MLVGRARAPFKEIDERRVLSTIQHNSRIGDLNFKEQRSMRQNGGFIFSKQELGMELDFSTITAIFNVYCSCWEDVLLWTKSVETFSKLFRFLLVSVPLINVDVSSLLTVHNL